MDHKVVHAIKFKIKSTKIIDDYFELIHKKTIAIIKFIKDGMGSADNDVKELIGFCMSVDAKVVAANLVPFFLHKEHKMRGNLEDATEGKTPPTRLMKRPALELRKRGVLPLPELAGMPQQIAAQAIFAALSVLKSWNECDKLTKESYTAAKALTEQMLSTVDKALYVKFTEWVRICESANYFKLNPGIAEKAIKKRFKFAAEQIMTALETNFPEWQVPYMGRTLLAHCCDITLQERRLTRLSNGANWTDPTPNTMNLHFMSSMPRFQLKWGDKLPEINVSINEKLVQLAICPGRHGYGNKIIQNVRAIMGVSCKHFITFTRHNHEFNGECNSICIHRSGNDYFVQLALSFEPKVAPAPYDVLDKLEKLLRYQKSSIATDDSPPPAMKVLAIDLGIRSLASYSIVERDNNGRVRIDSSGDISDRPDPFIKRTLGEFRNMIRNLRIAVNNLEEPVLETKKKLQPLADELKKKLGEFNCAYQFRGEPTGQWLEYAGILRDLRRVLIKLHTAGWGPREGKQKTLMFSRLLDAYSNFKDNLLNKLSFMITRFARESGVHVVVLEDLENFRMSGASSSQQNNLLALWSHRMIAESVERSLMMYGIGLDVVDQRHTSQLDPLIGSFAYRGKRDRSKLWVARPGEGVIALECDQAASSNIGIRYLLRHANMVWCKAVPVGDGVMVMTNSEANEPGIRMQGATLKLTGSKFGKFVPSDGGYELVGVPKRDYHKLLKGGDKHGLVELYRNSPSLVEDNGWYSVAADDMVFVDKATHYKNQDEIGRLAGVYDDDQTFMKFMVSQRFTKK